MFLSKKYSFILYILTFIVMLSLFLPRTYYDGQDVIFSDNFYKNFSIVVPLRLVSDNSQIGNNWMNLTENEIKNLSVLGRILYLDESPPPITEEKKYQIHVWKYGKATANRHLKKNKQSIDPFSMCSVKNCELTFEDDKVATADIVIFHLHQTSPKDPFPPVRKSSQIWAFSTDESPYHTFLKSNKLSNYDGVFNWSMTYRMDSDIPVPYGRTVRRINATKNEYLYLNKKRDVLVAILGSNCGGRNGRWDYVKELQKHIKVDVYGRCGTLRTCPGHFWSNCHDIDQYLFYLSFENSNCEGYITEKLWWNAFGKDSIPIVMGGMPNTYKKLLPPRSYLNVDDFSQPRDLASYIEYLNRTGEFTKYYQWKNEYEILNEHGYFQSPSYHYCRVCEALNYNDKTPKVYKNITQFWSVKNDCRGRQ